MRGNVAAGSGDCDRPAYAAAAAELGLSEDAARQAASRLRKCYRELLREDVAQTLAEPAEVDDEIRSFFPVSSDARPTRPRTTDLCASAALSTPLVLRG